MTGMTRIGLFCGLAVAISPVTAFTQFIPAQRPQGSPFGPLTPYRNQPYLGVGARTIYGTVTVGQSIPFNSPYNRVTNQPFYNWFVARPTAAPAPTVPWAGGVGAPGGGYMTGGAMNPNVMRDAQREFEKAQRQATTARLAPGQTSAKQVIDDEAAYEKFGLAGVPGALKGVSNDPDALVKALSVADESELLSGKALNQILAAVMSAEARGAKGQSAFLPPQVLAETQFSGSGAAEALNLLAKFGKLRFPIAFDDARLKDVRDEITKDFNAVAIPLRDGKLPEVGNLNKLGVSLQRARDLSPPVIQDIPFDDGTDARRFLNRFDAALVAMKSPSAFLLMNPAWATDGCSVADLVKHMTKHKLLFGPVGSGESDSYLALHKGLAAYLFVLTQPKK